MSTTRREALGLLVHAGALLGASSLLAACAGKSDSGSDTGDAEGDDTSSSDTSTDSGTDTSTDSGTDTGTGDCVVSDDTTAGPYPDTVGMVDDEAYYRSDITEGLYPDAVPLSLTVTVLDSDGCAPLSGVTVEIWHCDPDGHYSEYAGQPGYDGTGTTYLRGLQITDSDGSVTFSTIYPGWYIPRTTHIHLRIWQGGSVIKTTQVAFDDEVNAVVNASSGYGGSNSFTNDSDQVFVEEGDGYEDNLIAASGSVAAGYVGSVVLTV